MLGVSASRRITGQTSSWGQKEEWQLPRTGGEKQGANIGLQDTEFWRPWVQMAAQQWEGTEKQ